MNSQHSPQCRDYHLFRDEIKQIGKISQDKPHAVIKQVNSKNDYLRKNMTETKVFKIEYPEVYIVCPPAF